MTARQEESAVQLVGHAFSLLVSRAQPTSSPECWNDLSSMG
jgi:hypothetical protein